MDALRRLDPRQRAALARRVRARRAGGFHPAQLSAVLGAIYSLEASTPVAGEWESVTDLFGGSPLAQTDADRKLAASTANNGLPIGVYDGTDVWRMPLGANNFNTTKFGLALWLKLGGTAGAAVFAIYNNDATNRVLLLQTLSGALILTVYIGSNTDGRQYSTVNNLLSTTAYHYPRVQLDMTKTAECDTDGATADAKVRIFVDETPLALSAVDVGTGGTLTTLRTPNGAGIWGGLNDADAAVSALPNGTNHGPYTYIFKDTPTAAQAALLMNFKVPT